MRAITGSQRLAGIMLFGNGWRVKRLAVGAATTVAGSKIVRVSRKSPVRIAAVGTVFTNVLVACALRRPS